MEMEIFHVSMDASCASYLALGSEKVDDRQTARRRTPSPILGKRRRQGSYEEHSARYDETSSADTNSVDRSDMLQANETTRDELVVEHLEDHIRTSQRWLREIRAENSSSSHSTTSTSIDSGNTGIFDSHDRGDRSELLDMASELLHVSAVATSQDRHVRLATAAANFLPFRRHMVHKFHLEIDIPGTESPVESSPNNDLGDSGMKQQEFVAEPLSGLSAQVDYTELVRTLHSDSIVPDSCPVPVLHENEDLVEHTNFGSVSTDLTSSQQNCGGQVSVKTDHVSDTSILEDRERSMDRDIDLNQSFRFWTRPPKASSLAIANQQHVRLASSPPLSSPHGHSHPLSSPSKLTDQHTPIQADEPLSQQSSFTSPDRIPTRIPAFGPTLSLAQLLGTEDLHEVYYPPGSTSSTESGSDASENMRLLPGGSYESSPTTKVKIVTRTLKKQMDVAFRRKDYYTPRARCVRSRPADEHQEWPPDQLERGYWRVDVSTWPTNDKIKFWQNITQAIRAGRIGWIGAVVEGVNEIGKGDVVRVYCFGGAVVHIWVFLFAMSNRRTVKDVQWIDGVGRTVVEVGEERPAGMGKTQV
ncbi:hypothetical protein V1525DRAFT_395373 [Lipomyces kononenkoae]|uniref:Uncharacterized protein n=1 Tax=Lipomyces kononenkoae TaxID=34357 RepID=A0ACC3T9G8_LIPKO